MAPLRLALVGLSSSSPSWLAMSHLPYLLSPRGLEKYQIVALLNSSLASAEAAIKTYNLDPSIIKAYGSAEELAQDREVDLVVVGTRVDVHYGNLKPLLEGWKAFSEGDGKGLAMGQKKKRGVYSEWPLASNLQQVEELITLAREGEVKTVVGTQGFASPVVKKVEKVLKSGRVGKVLSSEFRLSGVTAEREAVGEKTSYFAEREKGGNFWSIGGGHVIDMLQSILGELTNVKSHFALQRPLVPLTGSTGVVIKTIQSNTPDLLYLTGSLSASSSPVPVQENAALSLRMRRGPPFPGEPAFVWSITGKKGEIRVTSADSVGIILGTGEIKIEVHDFASDKVEEVKWEWEDWQEGLPGPARNVGAVYEGVHEAWTLGEGNTKEGREKRYNDWEVAGRRHRQVEKALSDNGF